VAPTVKGRPDTVAPVPLGVGAELGFVVGHIVSNIAGG
jgi:hypothetical protein